MFMDQQKTEHRREEESFFMLKNFSLRSTVYYHIKRKSLLFGHRVEFYWKKGNLQKWFSKKF